MITPSSPALTNSLSAQRVNAGPAKPVGQFEVKSTFVTNMLMPRPADRNEWLENRARALEWHERLRQQKYPLYQTPALRVIPAATALQKAQVLAQKEAAIKKLDVSKFIDTLKTEAKEALGPDLFDKLKKALRGDAKLLKADIDKNGGKGLRVLEDLRKSVHREFGADSSIGKMVSDAVTDAPQFVAHLNKTVDEMAQLSQTGPQRMDAAGAAIKHRQNESAKLAEQRMRSLPADSPQHHQALKTLGEAQGKFLRTFGEKVAEIMTTASKRLWPQHSVPIK